MDDSIVSVAGSHETELIILFHDPLHPCFVTVFERGGVGSRSTILPLNLMNCSGNSNKKQNYQYCFRTIARRDRRRSRKTGALLATLLTAVITAPTQTYAQEAFTERPTSSQDAYIQVSVTMAALIAGQIDTDMGSCIDEWYTAADGARDDRNRELRDRIAEYADFHASAVILASVQQACGEFAN